MTSSLEAQGLAVRAASRQLAQASNERRIAVLERVADTLKNREEELLAINAVEVDAYRESGAGRDRLTLTSQRIAGMADALRDIAAAGDPLFESVDASVRPNGLRVERLRVPLGVIGVVYENRPNVTSDVAGLCVRSGNVAFLRGSASALHSNVAVVAALQAGFVAAGLPREAAALVDDVSHEAAVEFMQLTDVLDVLIPRGGPSLIASMREHATVPIILDGDGNCHVYVDKDADLAMATAIIVNAKTQRPGVCNAMESLVLHEAVASDVLAALDDAMPQVRLLGDARAQALDARIEPASDDDFSKEFLDLVATVAIVDDVDQAIDHIARHGSGHSEAIVTNNAATADRFLARVDAAAVLANTSTRFVDGFELGLGAEVGISTQKLHARGPMGLDALMGIKWVIRGEGQVRR